MSDLPPAFQPREPEDAPRYPFISHIEASRWANGYNTCLEATDAVVLLRQRDRLAVMASKMLGTIAMGNEPKHWDTDKVVAMLEEALPKREEMEKENRT